MRKGNQKANEKDASRQVQDSELLSPIRSATELPVCASPGKTGGFELFVWGGEPQFSSCPGFVSWFCLGSKTTNKVDGLLGSPKGFLFF